MKYADIWPHVVDGFKVTCPRFGPGTFVDYQFNGLRINHAGGSSSGYTATAEDMAVEWSLVPDEIQLPGVTTKEQAARLAKADPAPPNVGKWGKPVPRRDAWGRPA